MLNKTLLYVHNLSKTYHDEDGEIQALDHVSFEVQDGEFLSIIGPSGCGKSTILSILSGMDSNYSGQITSKEDLTIGYMLQRDSLLEWKTILENCLLGLRIKKILNEENVLYVKELLKKYGLEDFMDKYPSSLSGGMRQRVALIRTLALKPDILLLDEPFSSLDYQTRLKVSEDVLNIIRMEEKSAIMVTHNLEEALVMSDTVIVLSSRPSHIKSIYHIDLDKNLTTLEKKKTKKFLDYYNQIWKDIDIHV